MIASTESEPHLLHNSSPFCLKRPCPQSGRPSSTKGHHRCKQVARRASTILPDSMVASRASTVLHARASPSQTVHPFFIQGRRASALLSPGVIAVAGSFSPSRQVCLWQVRRSSPSLACSPQHRSGNDRSSSYTASALLPPRVVAVAGRQHLGGYGLPRRLIRLLRPGRSGGHGGAHPLAVGPLLGHRGRAVGHLAGIHAGGEVVAHLAGGDQAVDPAGKVAGGLHVKP
mmetsp:Transcript_15766/g.47471  ORF Transcript_15766/g.47471 Transcript_15766/m.47471 type:complete len:229 (-) Transcript_15766:2367-3053(-)